MFPKQSKWAWSLCAPVWMHSPLRPYLAGRGKTWSIREACPSSILLLSTRTLASTSPSNMQSSRTLVCDALHPIRPLDFQRIGCFSNMHHFLQLKDFCLFDLRKPSFMCPCDSSQSLGSFLAYQIAWSTPLIYFWPVILHSVSTHSLFSQSVSVFPLEHFILMGQEYFTKLPSHLLFNSSPNGISCSFLTVHVFLSLCFNFIWRVTSVHIVPCSFWSVGLSHL